MDYDVEYTEEELKEQFGDATTFLKGKLQGTRYLGKQYLYPAISDFIINKTKWKKMKAGYVQDNSNFIIAMINHISNRKVMGMLNKIVEKLPYRFSRKDILNAIVCIIQQNDIDVLTLEYQSEPNEDFKSIWDKISERGHV